MITFYSELTMCHISLSFTITLKYWHSHPHLTEEKTERSEIKVEWKNGD